MQTALEHIINDAYEKGKLDAGMGVSSDLSLFVKCAAAQILGNDTDSCAAQYIPDGSIVELEDGRLGVFCARHGRKGYRMVRVSVELGVEVRAGARLIIHKYPHVLASQLVEALAA